MRALITGVSGQDGSYLSEFLLAKGYEVYGLVRSQSTDECKYRTQLTSVNLVNGDLLDQGSLDAAIQLARPTEIYNLAAQSSVSLSWKEPTLTADVTALGVARLLEAVRRYAPDAKFFQASSSTMFGDADGILNEESPCRPRSPYAIAKQYAHNVTMAYREKYGMFACCGICFSHESPRRRSDSVAQRVIRYIARATFGEETNKLRIPQLRVSRDCGFAGDYISAMWLMLQQATPGDYVIATGVSRSMQDFLEIAFGAAKLNWRDHTDIEDMDTRDSLSITARGDWSKARKVLGWAPQTGFKKLVQMMVESQIAQVGESCRKQKLAARSLYDPKAGEAISQ